ncbi:MAG TPA: sigma-70 family RNA polymerase sigma factor [Candidatus Angelobacter sp.]
MIYSSLSCDELVRACAESGETEAWQEFVRRFEKLISIVVWRVARRYGENNSDLVKDLVQETYAKVCDNDCRILREFKPHHQDAFFGMLRVTATNVARDYFRACTTDKRGSGIADIELTEAEGFISGSHSGPDDMERQILLQEIGEILNSVCPMARDREIFWLHYRYGLTASDIAKIRSYGLTDKGVESILHRLRGQLRARLAGKASAGQLISRAEGIQAEKPLSKGEGQL